VSNDGKYPSAPPAFLQARTHRTFVRRRSVASVWSEQWPTDRIGAILVSESAGSIDGSGFISDYPPLGINIPYLPLGHSLITRLFTRNSEIMVPTVQSNTVVIEQRINNVHNMMADLIL
jgi:hypothetical protein